MSKKRELRKMALAARRSMTQQQRADESGKIFERLIESENYLASNSIGLYASMTHEVSTDQIIVRALADGKRVALPRVDGDCLRFHWVDDPAVMIAGPFGLREPEASLPIANTDDLGLLVVPGVAFDRSGNRLGHGNGFYDRALRDYRGISCGLAFTCQLVKSIPMEPHDLPVKFIVSS